MKIESNEMKPPLSVIASKEEIGENRLVGPSEMRIDESEHGDELRGMAPKLEVQSAINADIELVDNATYRLDLDEKSETDREEVKSPVVAIADVNEKSDTDHEEIKSPLIT